jgi:hypothetical protein
MSFPEEKIESTVQRYVPTEKGARVIENGIGTKTNIRNVLRKEQSATKSDAMWTSIESICGNTCARREEKDDWKR